MNGGKQLLQMKLVLQQLPPLQKLEVQSSFEKEIELVSSVWQYPS